MIAEKDLSFVGVDQLGTLSHAEGMIDRHIEDILGLPYIYQKKIIDKNFRVVVDCINSTGAISVIPLLEKLGCEVIAINDEMDGEFIHNPEPLAKHLTQLSQAVTENQAHLGIAVDPDVDRLAFMCEDGNLFGEEYTLVAVADYLLSIKPGNTVSNLSSTRALADVTKKHGQKYTASAVGEVNVVNQMKATDAIIGGEGNGGVILPDLHYGRDALVGIAIFLNLLTDRDISMTQLKSSYPSYEMVKDKLQLTPEINVDVILDKAKSIFKNERINDIDGVKIDFENGWVHLRKSNTEPIIRIYSEGNTKSQAEELISKVKTAIFG